MKLNSFLSFALLSIMFVGQANADIQITEIYAGLSGEDGTADWFEVTNFGSSVFDTAGLYYDDESADPTLNGVLDSFQLQTGESAVFLIGGDQADIDEFNSIWSGVQNVGTTAAGGGLGGGGDSVFLFDSNILDANVVDSVTYDGSFDNVLANPGTDPTIFATIQVTPGGATFASSITDGLSAEFFNDNIGPNNGPDDSPIQLAGSPGTFTAIPEPSSAVVLGFALLGMTRRRR